MIEKTIVYTCPYCDEVFMTEKEVIDCLNEHPIVFTVKIPQYSHDCWGKPECDYEDSGNIFKTYEKASQYANSSNGEIGYKKLS